MTLSILFYSIIIFIIIFSLGVLLCLALYKWDYKRFFESKLWVKVRFWIPIYLIFLIVLYLQIWGALFATLIITLLVIKELARQPNKGLIVWIYALTVCLGCLCVAMSFASIGYQATQLLLVIGFSSVMSDVFAFFMGNFFGNHKMPNWINNTKSWEGVLGQVIGAIFGFYTIVFITDVEPNVILAVLIGLASAMGDLINSIVKRRLKIKDWGNTIPGHGGILDRMSSLSFAFIAAYCYMLYGGIF